MLYDLWDRYRKPLIVIAVLLAVLATWLFYPGPSETRSPLPLETPAYASETGMEQAPPPSAKRSGADGTEAPAGNGETADKDEPSESEPDPLLYVDVKGSVRHPGLYPVAAGERIQAVVAKAGGFLPQADVNRVNLAQPVSDGMVVWIPAKGETPPNGFFPAPITGDGPREPTGLSPGAQAASPSAGAAKVNLNTATLAQLLTLPGIGETRAKAILAYRERHGPFHSPDEVKNVGGIGDKTYERLKGMLTAP